MPDPDSRRLTDDELTAEFNWPGGVRDLVFGGTRILTTTKRRVRDAAPGTNPWPGTEPALRAS